MLLAPGGTQKQAMDNTTTYRCHQPQTDHHMVAIHHLADGREVVVNRLAGESVLKGANVFAPGMLAATPGIAAGDLVAISVALEQPGG